MAATSDEKKPLLGSDHGSEDASDEEASIAEDVGVLSSSSIKEDASDQPPSQEATGKKAFYKYLPGYGVFRMVKKASPYSLYVLMLLLAAYLLNQLNRYTLPVTTKAVAQDVHYGSKSCMISEAAEHNHWISQAEVKELCSDNAHK